MENGSEIRREKRNIHFMNVTTLYFEINGRKAPRYSAKLRLFIRRRTIPNGVVLDAPP